MEKARLKKLLIAVGAILFAGILYYVIILQTGFSIPCIIYETTGIYCAACGITRMFSALFRLDFISAAKSNIFALVLILPTIIFAFKKGRKYLKNGKLKLSKSEIIIIAIVLALAVIFMVLRNLPQFSFLSPN